MASDLIPRRAPKGGRSHAMQSAPQIDPSLRPAVDAVLKQFPALARYKDDFAVMRGRPMLPGMQGLGPNGTTWIDDRQLESYPMDESWNPMPGKFTTELYNSDVPLAEQTNLIAGDFLHHLALVDPQWDAMKRDVLPAELKADDRTYESRGDEYLMGYLTPDAADHWRGAYKPETVKKLEKMRSYLLGQKAP